MHNHYENDDYEKWIVIEDGTIKYRSRTFVGEVLEDDLIDGIGTTKYNSKTYLYPSGKSQTVISNSKVFRIPVPGLGNDKRQPRHIYYDMEGNRCDINGDPIDIRRSDNILRSHQRIQQIILSNEWDYFMTCTFNDEKVCASDVPRVLKKTEKWLSNMVQRNGIGYLLVPEYHKKDERVHFHALVSGKLPLEFNDIYAVKGIKKPVRLESIKRYHQEARIQYPIYNVASWGYGFSTAIDVYGSPSRLANYVKKYITKSTKMIFGKSYWCSKNLKLYPTVSLDNISDEDYNECFAKSYYSPQLGASFKYINKLGDILEDEVDDEVVLRL